MEFYGYAYTVTDLLDILQANEISKNATIRVKGEEAHAVAAEYICKLVYGIDVDDPACTDAAEYYLEQKHWIKATRGYMWNIYLEHRDSWEMTRATYGALVRYCDFHQLGIPKGVVIIRGN